LIVRKAVKAPERTINALSLNLDTLCRDIAANPDPVRTQAKNPPST
jgi:hypothetical protein